ncbi:MAG: metallophosphoesterase [Calditrichaeota bacterium]|nr:metallophosphoesterase [Calditrichota bacterium]
MDRVRVWLCGTAVVMGVALAAIGGSWSSSADDSGKELRFAVLGDNRPGTRTARQPYVHKLLLKELKARKPIAVLNTGDIIVGGTDDSLTLRRMFEEFMKTVSPLEVPLHVAPGNHDYFNRPSRALFAEMVGKPYYSMDYGSCHFVILCSEEEGHVSRLSREQFLWLKRDLEAHRQMPHLFVFVHRPLYPVGPHAGDSFDKYPAHRDSLAALFLEHGVDIVFVGHEHLYHDATYGGLRQVITGGAGAPLYAPPDSGGYFHFIMVTVRGKEVLTEVVRVDDPYEKAEEAFRQRKPAEVLNLMDEVLNDSPDQSDAHLYKAVAYLQAREPGRAAEELAAFLKGEGRVAAAYERAGRMLLKHGLWEQARALYREFANDKPASPEAYLGLGESFFHLSYADSASLCLERAVELDSLAPKLRFLAGQLYENGKKVVEAIRHYQAAVRLGPETSYGLRAAKRLAELKPGQ